MRVLRPLMLATALSLSLSALSPLAAFAQLDDTRLPAAQEGHQGALPYTTYAAERQAVLDKLYCKWTSEDGRDGGGRYDFLCVGGNWATVHLMLDKSHRVGGGLSRVRLLWREWPAEHPAAAENVVAQEFLQYAADRFIAPKLAPEVMQSFFGARSRDWQNGDVRIHYELTDNQTHRLHRLEIIGLGTALKIPHLAEPENSFDKKLMWPASKAPDVIRMAPVTTPDRLPLQLPLATQPPAPQPATSNDISPQPEPESLKKPVAAPLPSPALVPATAIRPNAPSNFDTYNKAQALTRDVEEKAFGKAPPPLALPAGGATATPEKSGGLIKAGPVEAAPPVVAVPTPEVSGSTVTGSVKVVSPLTVPATVTKTMSEGEGLGSPSTTPADTMTPAQKAAQKAGAAVTAPSTVAPWQQPQPTGPARPLPQLKYIPKAQPLDNPAETIQFEDEKSKL